MGDERDEEIEALKARLSSLERPNPTITPSKQNGCLTAVMIGGVLIAALFVIAQCTGSGSPSAVTASAPAWTPPEGYSPYPTSQGGAVGLKWEEATDDDCRGGLRCWAATIITPEGCPRSLYASITLLDRAGQNVGWTNDSAQGVRAMEPSRLAFSTYERNGRTARVAEISCY